MTKLSPEDLRKLLAEVSPARDWSVVASDASLSAAGLDSLDKASFILRVEEQTDRSIPDEDFDKLDSLQAVSDYVGA